VLAVVNAVELAIFVPRNTQALGRLSVKPKLKLIATFDTAQESHRGTAFRARHYSVAVPTRFERTIAADCG